MNLSFVKENTECTNTWCFPEGIFMLPDTGTIRNVVSHPSSLNIIAPWTRTLSVTKRQDGIIISGPQTMKNGATLDLAERDVRVQT